MTLYCMHIRTIMKMQNRDPLVWLIESAKRSPSNKSDTSHVVVSCNQLTTSNKTASLFTF